MLRRCCFALENEDVLGKPFLFAFWPHYKKNIAGFMQFSRMGNKSFVQTITIIESRYINV